MRKIYQLSILLIVAAISIGCYKINQIDATSEKRLLRSLTHFTGSLYGKDRIEFQAAFFFLKQYGGSAEAFRQTVNKKTPQEVIEIAKADYSKKIAERDKDFQQYESWDAMISALVKERKQDPPRDMRVQGATNDKTGF